MIWYIIITLFCILLLWILLGPVILTLDTSGNVYRFMLPGVVSLSLIPTRDFFRIHGWILFVPFRMDPLKMGKSRRRMRKRKKREENTDTDKKKEQKQRGRQKGLETMKKFRKVAGAIRVRRLEMDIDTDDYQLNAWLVPAFAAVNSYKNVQMQVNFEGNLSMHLDVRTRVGTVIWRILPWT
jgi:hypothetical protein